VSPCGFCPMILKIVRIKEGLGSLIKLTIFDQIRLLLLLLILLIQFKGPKKRKKKTKRKKEKEKKNL
jgi:hypothetical protein